MDMGEQPGNGGYEDMDYGHEPHDVTAYSPDVSGPDPDMMNHEIASDAQPVGDISDKELPLAGQSLNEKLLSVFDAAAQPAYRVAGLSEEVARTTADLQREEAAFEAVRVPYEERIADLRGAAARAAHGIEAAEKEITAIFRQGRTDTWQLMEKTEGGYAVGEKSVSVAVVLSPKDDTGEDVNWHIARSRTARDINEQISAGVPVLLSKREGGKPPVYCAAVPEQDGLSVRLDDHDPERPVYMLGVGDQTNIRVDDAFTVIPGDSGWPLYAAPTFEIETGGAVAETLTSDCKMFVDAHEATQASIAEVLKPTTDHFTTYYRNLTHNRHVLRESMVAVINTARQLGVQPDIGPTDQVAAIALREHMLDAGDMDTYSAEYVQTIAEALHHIYPRDAMVTAQEFIVNASRQRELSTHGGHRQFAVVEVLHGVFGMEHDDAMRAVYGERN
jgi:hypothetical protein